METSIVNINECSFSGMRSDIGGAILMRNSHMEVASSRFVNNSATTGGAIYFGCLTSETGSLTFQEENTFVNNTAVNGGYLYYDLFEPIYQGTITEQDNSADHGDQVAAYPASLNIPASNFFSELASGQTIRTPLNVLIIYANGQVIVNDNERLESSIVYSL